MKKNLFLKPLDFVIILIAIAIIIYTVTAFTHIKGGSPMLVIDTKGAQYIYDLNTDRTVKIEGVLGISTIEIKDGKAYFTDSPCPNKICVQSFPVHSANDWAACMPNDVFIHIEDGQNKSGIDITR